MSKDAPGRYSVRESHDARKLAAAKAEARAQGSLEANVDWIRSELEKGHICLYESVIENHTKRLDWMRSTAVGLFLASIGLATTLMVQCNTHGERDAETRVLVRTNSENIEELEENVSKMVESHTKDTQNIIEAVHELKTTAREETAESWWKSLTPSQKHGVSRIVGRKSVPTNGEVGSR